MSLPFRSEPLASICDDARLLVERAGSHEDHLEAFAAAADTGLRHAQAELSQALALTTSSADQFRSMLRLQLQRSVDGAHAARQLVVGAREQHVAAARLLSRLDGDRTTDESGTGSSRRNTVLVVDDYRDVREVVSEVLQNAGFVVRTAVNGLEALIAAYEMRPAVIVMDVTMPVLDGLEATRLIKASDATRHARVIAYTGNPILGETRVQKLFVAVLQKPATPDAVVATVRHAASQ